jgi:putative ABC transport system permease protein
MRVSRDLVTQSLRLLTRHKRFSATAILCLGIGIALNTTMYSVLDAMLSPKIEMRDPASVFKFVYYGNNRRLLTEGEKNTAIREHTSFHAGVAGTARAGFDRIVERGGRLREARIITVTPNYFSVLGSKPSAGRLLLESDLGMGVRPVVLGERLWKQLFPELGSFAQSEILVNGEPRTVVGLLPYSADFPGQYTDVWQLPLPADLDNVTLSVFRLKPGITAAQAIAELDIVDARLKTRTNEGREAGFRVSSAITRPFRVLSFHWAMIGAVVSVLLIACANLANLQLARGVSRTRELATRTAVGASRADIIAQLVMESAWLAAAGLALGAILTVWGIQLVEANVPTEIAGYVAYPQVSWRVVAVAVGATLFCLIVVGLAPAIKLSRVDVNELLKSGAGTGATRSARAQYGVLVVTEVALALALLASASLLTKAAFTVRAFDYRGDSKGLIVTNVRVSPASPTDRTNRREWAERLVQHALTADSVVGAAVAVAERPPSRSISTYDFAGQPVNKFTPMLSYTLVTPEYFRVSRFPIIAGRDFSPGEFAEPQIIIDRAAAASLWPNQSPIGKQMKLDSAHKRSPWLRVVGVADPSEDYFRSDQDQAAFERQWRASADGRFRGRVWVLNAADTSNVMGRKYRNGFTGAFVTLYTRGRGDPRRVAMMLNRRMATMGPNITALYSSTWEEYTGTARLRARHDFIATLFTTFAFFALALATLGVYAIIAHMVAQRTREFGVRIAVGAGERDIRQLVLREGNVLTLSGIAVGLLVTYFTAGWVRAFVFSDWDRYDSRVFAAAALVLFLAAWIASYWPARRAMRINPVEALRND